MTIQMKTPSGSFSINGFVIDLTTLLQIPTNVITFAEVDFDLSSTSKTVVVLTMQNVGSFDPVAVANKLKTLIASNDPTLQAYSLESLSVEEAISPAVRMSWSVASVLFGFLFAIFGARFF